MLSRTKIATDGLGQMLVNICDQKIELGEYSFLTDVFGKVIYIDDIDLDDADEIFLCVTQHYSGLAASSLRTNMSSLIGNHLKTSARFRYVLGSDYGSISSLYNQVRINQDNRDLNLIKFSAFQRLLTCVEEKGLQVCGIDEGNYEVATYTGPNGGSGPLRDPKLKRGSSISRHGLRMRFSVNSNPASTSPGAEVPSSGGTSDRV